MKAVILAGGKGTRMGDMSRLIPKPMVEILGKPLLQYQVELLQRYGFNDIIIITGHLSHIIEDYFGNGDRLGVNIRYYVETTPLGTTGGIKEMESYLQDDFLVLYGDVLVDMDLNRLMEYHKERNGIATLVLHPNDHPMDSDLVELDPTKKVVAFHSKPHDPSRYYHNLVNAALFAMSPEILSYIPKSEKADFGKDIFPKLIQHEHVFGYPTSEYLKDVGTPERLLEVTHDVVSGKVSGSNLGNPRKAVFIDRDGTLNKSVGLLHRIEDLELYPFSGEAIRKINASDHLAILITNQPVVARGLCTPEELDDIHKKMETLLGREGAKLDAIYHCPHHPDSGFPGENPEYKITCTCRKPDIGMIQQAVKDHHIDLARSFFIGDSFRDIECGRKAGVTTIGVITGDGCKDPVHDPDHFADNLLEAVKLILDRYQ